MAKKSSKNNWLLFLDSILIILAGICIVSWSYYLESTAIKSKLLASTETLASAVDPALLEKLTGKIQDQDTENYQNLSAWIKKINKSLEKENIAQISILSKSDNNIFFFNVDSSLDSKRMIVPGTVYKKPPFVLKTALMTGNSFVAGPYNDEYGSYLSAFVPVFVSNGRYMVITASIEKSKYEYVLGNSQAPFTITILVILLLGIIIRRDRINRKQEIKESENRLKIITNSISEGIFTTDKKGLVDFWSGSAENLFGYSFDEVKRKNIKDIIYDKKDKTSKKMFRNFYLQFIKNKKNKNKDTTETKLKKKSGELFIAEISLTRVFKNDEDHTVWVVKDITDKKDNAIAREMMEQEMINRSNELEKSNIKLKKALSRVDKEKNKAQEAQAKDEAYLSSIGEGVLVIDQQEKIVRANPQVRIILGYDPEDLIGKNILEKLVLVDENGRQVDISNRPIKSALKENRKLYFKNYSYISKSGKIIPVTITLAPVILNNKIIGVVNIFHDATEEREVNRAKTEFVSLASHQLRTPLSSINWYAEMLLNGDGGMLNKDQKEYVEEIYNGSKRMVELVNALLNASRIDMGTFFADLVPTNFVEIAEDVIKELEPQIQEREQIIERKYDPNLPLIKSDPKMIRIIFQNYLSNAVKYSPKKGKITLKIYIKKKQLIIEVADNGYGIPENQQDEIFLKLFRADNIKDKNTEGTGLGLYIVKSIVEELKGKVWFDSKENQGSVFYASIPLNFNQPIDPKN